MSRFVFREATPEMLECAMPLHAELAVLRMEWALTKLRERQGLIPLSRVCRRATPMAASGPMQAAADG